MHETFPTQTDTNENVKRNIFTTKIIREMRIKIKPAMIPCIHQIQNKIENFPSIFPSKLSFLRRKVKKLYRDCSPQNIVTGLDTKEMLFSKFPFASIVEYTTSMVAFHIKTPTADFVHLNVGISLNLHLPLQIHHEN